MVFGVDSHGYPQAWVLDASHGADASSVVNPDVPIGGMDGGGVFYRLPEFPSGARSLGISDGLQVPWVRFPVAVFGMGFIAFPPCRCGCFSPYQVLFGWRPVSRFFKVSENFEL